MEIEFIPIERHRRFIFTSPQLPYWICSGPDLKAAQDLVKGSLRCYLRNERGIDPEIRRELVNMVGVKR